MPVDNITLLSILNKQWLNEVLNQVSTELQTKLTLLHRNQRSQHSYASKDVKYNQYTLFQRKVSLIVGQLVY